MINIFRKFDCQFLSLNVPIVDICLKIYKLVTFHLSFSMFSTICPHYLVFSFVSNSNMFLIFLFSSLPLLLLLAPVLPVDHAVELLQADQTSARLSE